MVEGEFFIDNLLVRIHFIIVMIRRTGLAPWEFEFSFPGSLTSTFLVGWWYLTDEADCERERARLLALVDAVQCLEFGVWCLLF